ncbi:MAG: hypothetical protein ACFB6S_06985 [Geminicoccaceae bacterium]
MRTAIHFSRSLAAGHGAFNRKPWPKGASRTTIEDRLVALFRRVSGGRR